MSPAEFDLLRSLALSTMLLCTQHEGKEAHIHKETHI